MVGVGLNSVTVMVKVWVAALYATTNLVGRNCSRSSTHEF